MRRKPFLQATLDFTGKPTRLSLHKLSDRVHPSEDGGCYVEYQKIRGRWCSYKLLEPASEIERRIALFKSKGQLDLFPWR